MFLYVMANTLSGLPEEFVSQQLQGLVHDPTTGLVFVAMSDRSEGVEQARGCVQVYGCVCGRVCVLNVFMLCVYVSFSLSFSLCLCLCLSLSLSISLSLSLSLLTLNVFSVSAWDVVLIAPGRFR